MTERLVSTASGPVTEGPQDGLGVRAFKGLPYAAAPTGALRWKAPQPVVAWTQPRSAQSFGPNAPQRVLFDDIDPFAIGVSEDCLYLNVWTPAGAGAKLPVLFWIHGGGFAVGSGAEPRYDGARLAAQGIVVVTVNTRLNALGFLAHPALTAEAGASGNYAMLDLIAALQWVKRNIAQFGGDAGAVTTAGESAGSMFVSLLMSTGKAKGLFHRAIGQSGAWFPSPERPMRGLAEAEDQGLEFAARLGARTAQELRVVSVEKILDANPGLGFWPITDGHVIADHPPHVFARGEQADVPLLAGWNKDEGFNFNVSQWPALKGKSFKQIVAALFPADAKKVLAHYASPRDLGGDLVINHSAWAWIEAHRATAKSEVFRYRFDRAPTTPKGWFPDGAKAGAFHSCEILYMFNNLDAFPWLVDGDDQKVAERMSGYWLNFIKTGTPNGGGLPEWPSYRQAGRPVAILDVKSSILNDIDRGRHTMMAGLVSAGK